jgi:hypothetical protein
MELFLRHLIGLFISRERGKKEEPAKNQANSAPPLFRDSPDMPLFSFPNEGCFLFSLFYKEG